MKNLKIGINGFNTQPPEGGWQDIGVNLNVNEPFQHTAARRRLGGLLFLNSKDSWFQHTAARRRLALNEHLTRFGLACFNTQPPEGGWVNGRNTITANSKFQHTAARRRLESTSLLCRVITAVSTHSRPKAAGPVPCPTKELTTVSTHSRPKAAGHKKIYQINYRGFQHTAARRRLVSVGICSCGEFCVSTHSRPKAAGF